MVILVRVEYLNSLYVPQPACLLRSSRRSQWRLWG